MRIPDMHRWRGCKSGKCFDCVDPAVFHFTCASFVGGKGLSVFADVYRLQPDGFDSLRMWYASLMILVIFAGIFAGKMRMNGRTIFWGHRDTCFQTSLLACSWLRSVALVQRGVIKRRCRFVISCHIMSYPSHPTSQAFWRALKESKYSAPNAQDLQ